MIHLSSYHSNGLPTVVWSNKVNLIGEKVYKPKIHFCEHCNKPILIYGRLIPCKHVFCFTCATLCLTQQQTSINKQQISATSPTPTIPGPSEPPPPPPMITSHHQSPLLHNHSPHTHNHGHNNLNHRSNDKHYHQKQSRGNHHQNHHHHSSSNSGGKNIDFNRSDSNQSFSLKDGNGSNLMNVDDSTSNTTPTTIQQDTINSPNFNSTNGTTFIGKGCHRCGGKTLRVERNTLNSIFVCQVETCRRTYLSARDLQAHVNHRHSKNKANSNAGTSSALLAAISSSPYITSSSLQHLKNHSQNNNHRQSSSSHSRANNSSNSNNNNNNSTNSPSQNHHHHKHDRDYPHPRHHRDRERDRDRFRERDTFQRDRERERDNKEYHRQSLQRAAQWAEQSAQMLEKGLTR